MDVGVWGREREREISAFYRMKNSHKFKGAPSPPFYGLTPSAQLYSLFLAPHLLIL